MKAIDRVYKILSTRHRDEKLTTQQVAAAVGLTRGVVSSYLSQLAKTGKIAKSGTRPVFWEVNAPASAFDAFIGAQGSLHDVVASCREAIVYPPHGLPILITGPSGVGKSFLARVIFNEAQRTGIIPAEGRFVVLNAADYANNPELLSSVLFGYKKGAFTGANADSPGLLDRADNGYLFLDEIHRLPPAAQEKLFSLLDSGDFYPLGENKQVHHVNVRFVFATTEDTTNVLLKTFLRRVPLQVALPPFIARTLNERTTLVLNAFKNEAKRINQPVQITLPTLINLANTNAPGNVGMMENRVKLLCAAAYAQSADDANPILVGQDNGLHITITADTALQRLQLLPTQITHIFAQLATRLAQSLQDTDDINEQNLVVRQTMRTLTNLTDAALIDPLQQQLQTATKTVLHNRYGIRLPQDNSFWRRNAVALYCVQMGINQSDNTAFTTLANLIQTKYPRSAYLFSQLIPQIAEAHAEAIWIMFPLLIQPVVKDVESIPYNGILLAHGESTAASIQSVVNNLCGNYLFESFDMPIDVSIHEINQRVQNYLATQRAGKSGTFVLFDMGSLNQMFSEIKKTQDQKLLVINNLTTAMALDVGLRMQRKDSFTTIAQASHRYGETTGTQYFEGLSDQKNIIVSCMSGVGLSEEIRRMMRNTLSGKEQIITMDYKDLRSTLDNHDQRFFDKTQFVLTTTDITTDLDIAIVNIYDIMENQGFHHLVRLLTDAGEQPANCQHFMDQLLKFFSIEGIRDRLQFLNPDVVINEVEKITTSYQDYYGIELAGKVRLNLYMHLALMIERMLLASQRADKASAIKIDTDQEREFFSVSHTIFHGIEVKYNFKVADYEISLMYQLLSPYI
ncbi:MAG: sigma 54-interacting transcriptional regulator [Schleiferilactobacillus harbinensis]|jgi:transcriptional regulator with AAA-type ATPase domain/transcriptional regulatory protein LevR|nr:sigma 54-interacting transcriptional regulator [Schleiferilactobacillus harbinensis]MCI1912412.1 sigma 54-interacting transcriptional regulator [Schleiferilactobacillus harbinensis]